MSNGVQVRSVGRFLLDNKRYWLTPIAVVLGLLALLVALTEPSTVAPFIYTLF